MAEFASKGVSGTALGLGIAGTVGLVNSMSQNGNGFLGGLFGGNNNQFEELRAENTLLKSQQYTDAADKELASEVCQLKAEVAVMKKEAELQGQLTDCKISKVADAANCGISALQCSLDCLQRTVAGITRTSVPAQAVTPLPAPWPYPPVPPYFVPPTAASVQNGTQSGTETTGA